MSTPTNLVDDNYPTGGLRQSKYPTRAAGGQPDALDAPLAMATCSVRRATMAAYYEDVDLFVTQSVRWAYYAQTFSDERVNHYMAPEAYDRVDNHRR